MNYMDTMMLKTKRHYVDDVNKTLQQSRVNTDICAACSQVYHLKGTIGPSAYSELLTGKWNFEKGSVINANTFSYTIYKLPPETRVIGINAYQQDNRVAAYGFYDGDPSSDSEAKCIYYSAYPDFTTMSKYNGEAVTLVSVPDNAKFVIANFGEITEDVGIWYYFPGVPDKKLDENDDGFTLYENKRWNFSTKMYDEEDGCYYIKYIVPDDVETLGVWGYRYSGGGIVQYGYYRGDPDGDGYLLYSSPRSGPLDSEGPKPVSFPGKNVYLLVNVGKAPYKRGIWTVRQTEASMGYRTIEACTKGSYYDDMCQDKFEEMILKCAASYLVHQVNNTQISGTPSDSAPMFYSMYANISWRQLLFAAKACNFQAKNTIAYSDGYVYPIYYSHCTPFASSLTSGVPYESSPWRYMFENPQQMGIEKYWRLSQERGNDIDVPYTYSYPDINGAGPEVAYCSAKNGSGLICIARKYVNDFVYYGDVIKTLRTGDWLHLLRKNISGEFLGHGHSAIYVKTIDEIAKAVRKYYPGCELVSWFKNDPEDPDDPNEGKYGYAVEVTSGAVDGMDYIRVSDIQAMMKRSAYNTTLCVSRSRSTPANSTVARRYCNNAGELYFIHQPYSAICVNEEPLEMNVLMSKEYVSYQWQYSADGETWTDIANKTDKRLELQYPTDGTYYRCAVTDNCTNHKVFSDPVKCYIVDVNDPSSSVPSSGTYRTTVAVSGTSANDCFVRWDVQTSVNGVYEKFTDSTRGSSELNISVGEHVGSRFRARVTFPGGMFYCTPSVLIQ